MRRRVAILAVALAVLAAGCGDGSSSSSTTATADAGTTAAVSDETAAIEATIRTWVLEGDCDLMTDKFLEAQTFESNPKRACKLFESLFEAPQYGAEDIEISEVEIDGDRASAVVGDAGAGVTITYKLVLDDGQWKIDAVS